MARVNVTQVDVLKSVVERLRASLGLNPRRCYMVLYPLAPTITTASGDYFVTVAPGGGQFVDGEQVAPNITEEWSVVVTINTHVHLDSLESEAILLCDPARGILAIKAKVLAAMVGADLLAPDATGGEGANTFLRQLIHAVDADKIGYSDEKKIAWLSITFGVSFDWDLSE